MKKIILLFLLFALSLISLPRILLHSDTNYNTEEKKEPIVSIDQDFSLNSICVMLKYYRTLDMKEYTIEDFLYFSPDKVIEADSYLYDLIKEKIKGNKVPKNIDEKDYSSYHRTLYLKWNENLSKETIIDYIFLLSERDDVYYVEADYYSKWASNVPDDPLFSQNLSNVSNMNLVECWDYSTGSNSISVGVIDTGISQHVDLSDNLNNSLHKDFSTDIVSDQDPFSDIIGHGTNVAGVIGEKGDNPIGYAGICWNVNIISLKVSDGLSAMTSSVVQAIYYAESIGIPILNYSAILSGLNNPNASQELLALYYAISYYSGLFVCAAGNSGDNNDINPKYPANFSTTLSNVICVGAHDNNNVRYNSNGMPSCYGENSVSIFAYGDSIMTTSNDGISYESFNYTSAATAVVSGVAALLLSCNSNLTTSMIKTSLLSTAYLMHIHVGVADYDAKRLNPLAAIKYAISNYSSNFVLDANSGTYSDTVSIGINNGLISQKFYKIEVLDEENYLFEFNSLYSLNVLVFDNNFINIEHNNLSSIGGMRFIKHLNVGYYYIKISFTNNNWTGNVTTKLIFQNNVSISPNIQNTFINTTNQINNYYFLNTVGSGYYYVSFNGISSLGNSIDMPDDAFKIYSDSRRSQLLNKTGVSNVVFDAVSYSNPDTIVCFFNNNSYYYFDVELNISDLASFQITITPVMQTQVNTFNNNLVSPIYLFNNAPINDDNYTKIIINDDLDLTIRVFNYSNYNSVFFILVKVETVNNTTIVSNIGFAEVSHNSIFSLDVELDSGTYYFANICNGLSGTFSLYIE